MVFIIQVLRISATVLASVRRREGLAWRDAWRWVLRYPDTLAAKAVNLRIWPSFGGPKEAKMEPKSMPRLSGDAMLSAI